MPNAVRTKTENDNKKQFGQFFTSNCDYVLHGLENYVRGKVITDPFAGSGDLLKWALRNGAKNVKGHEIDRSYVDNKNIFFKDSIKNPEHYKFVLTNPPYLNINKADEKTKKIYFKGSGFEDLYHISLASILRSEEGIIIVPVNFLSSSRAKKIRNKFFSDFIIAEMNYFRHPVFSDTTNNVIAFYYCKKNSFFDDKFTIKAHIYPDNKIVAVKLNKHSDWTIGGDFLNMVNSQKNHLGIKRLLEEDINKNPGRNRIKAAYSHVKDRRIVNVSSAMKKIIDSNIVILKSIDSGTEAGKISLEDVRENKIKCLISKPSSRHMIHLIFPESVSVKDQERLIRLFNKEFNDTREKTLSLFLTNYRDNDRKRVSFDFVYKFLNHLYFKKVRS